MAAIDLRLRTAITGISGILVTPFDVDDKVAPTRLKPIIDRAIDAGVHVLVANGNTGEFYGLTTAEAVTMVHSIAEQIGGRVPLLGGVGRSIGDACALAKASRAERVGIDGAPAAGPVRLPSRRCRLCEADRGSRRRLAADAVPAQRRDRSWHDRNLVPSEGVAGVEWAAPTLFAWQRQFAVPAATSSGSAASPRPGHPRFARSVRAALPLA